MQFARDMESLQEAVAGIMRSGRRIALVPTMGALHAGHRSLIERANAEADAVIVSIFVNPKQFGPNEDFARYPRMLEQDMRQAEQAGAALVYAPTPDDMYPGGFSSSISVGELGRILEGQFRPGFFEGVATVVAKLLLRALPHVAVFGEKDYQQLCVVRRLVEDMDIPVEIIGAPTLREADGLALSSRNAYLSPDERAAAPRLHEVLSRVGEAIAARRVTAHAALERGINSLSEAGFRVDYLELRAEETLEPVARLESPARLLAAAWLGVTRLIDNVRVEA